MEFNWSTIAWIAGLLFVYIFGLYEGRGQGYKKRKAEEQEEKKTHTPPEPETVTIDDPGILRIKNETGTFALDLDGNRVNPISLLPEQRKRLIEILNIMRPWLEGKPVSPPAATSESPAFHSAATPSIQTRSSPVQPAAPTTTSQSSSPKPAVIPVEDRPAAPANSIVTQIDTILQARLTGTPLEERGIFLTQSPEGGVNVYIGLKRYNGIDEVPDPEVKAAIRGAITEWENKYTPGL